MESSEEFGKKLKEVLEVVFLHYLTFPVQMRVILHG